MKAGISRKILLPRYPSVLTEVEKHSTAQSILLHLFPGMLVGCFYFLSRQPVASLGYPSIFALLLAFAFV